MQDEKEWTQENLGSCEENLGGKKRVEGVEHRYFPNTLTGHVVVSVVASLPLSRPGKFHDAR